MMRQQKATDACIDVLRRKRPNVKPQPVVGTLSKPPGAFPAFDSLEDEALQADLSPGIVTPKVCLFTLLVAMLGMQNIGPCCSLVPFPVAKG